MIEFKTEQFQGPLGLLLSLIEKQELDITEIALASIASKYLEYVKSASDIKVGELSDFLLIAAKLLYIKSKALLPFLSNDEEEEEIKDLEKQLKIYKKFAEASQKIEEIIGNKNFSYIKEFKNAKQRRKFMNLESFIAPKNLRAQDLKEVYNNIIKGLNQEKKQPLEEEKLDYAVSVEERIDFIQVELKKKLQVSFNKIIKRTTSKVEVIVNFLAVLELAKQNEIKIDQTKIFSDIRLSY